MEIDQKALEKAISRIRGAPLIKYFKVEGDVLIIVYYASFREYKRDNPESKVSEEFYDMYWGTGDQITKTFVAESARILRDFKQLNCVKMLITFRRHLHRHLLERKGFNHSYGMGVEDVQDLDKWRTEYIDEFVYRREKRPVRPDRLI